MSKLREEAAERKASARKAALRFSLSSFLFSFFPALLLLLCVGCGQKLSDKIYWKGEDAKVTTEDERGMAVVYVALGDSTGAGVGARKGGGYVARIFERIERVRPGSRLVNLCVSGATTADVLRSQVSRIGEAQPTLVTLGIGINDVSRQVSVEQFARNYEEIILRIKKETSAPIVLSNIPDVSHAPAVPAFLRAEALRRINLYNRSIEEIAARQGLLVVDAYEKSHAVIPTHPEFFSSDGFHPSDEGYEFWAVTMWPTVKQAIGVDE